MESFLEVWGFIFRLSILFLTFDIQMASVRGTGKRSGGPLHGVGQKWAADDPDDAERTPDYYEVILSNFCSTDRGATHLQTPVSPGPGGLQGSTFGRWSVRYLQKWRLNDKTDQFYGAVMVVDKRENKLDCNLDQREMYVSQPWPSDEVRYPCAFFGMENLVK